MGVKGNRQIMKEYLGEATRRADEALVDATTALPGAPVDPVAARLQGLADGARILGGILWPSLDLVALMALIGEIDHELTVEASGVPFLRHA